MLCENAGTGKVFEKIPNGADVHHYRAVFASRVYEKFARPISSLQSSERYCCRGAKAGTVYDRSALLEASKQLGHNRISVVASHYLYTKSSASNRIHYLDDELVSFLKNIQKKQAQHKLDLGNAYLDTIRYVYVRDDGKTYYPDTVEKQLKKFLKKHGLPPVGLHELRHTYCSRLLTGGIDLTTVQHLMGHSDPRMTLGVYAHVSPEKAEQARGAMRRCLESSGLEAAASNGRH